MDDNRRREISSIHDDLLDAEFETFEHSGSIYHNVGIMNAWVRGYTDPDTHMLADPPTWTQEFMEWLERNGSTILELMVGPPVIRFPDADTAEAFRTEWHEKSRERYPYVQQERYQQELSKSISHGINADFT